MHQLFQLLSELFYPHYCPGCGAEVQDEGLLCEICRQEVWNPRSMHPESLEAPFLDGVYVLYNYEGGIQKALQLVKFQKREDLLPRLAKTWAEGIHEAALFQWDIPEGVKIALVTIPTDAMRKKERGYDIPEEIFRPWGKARGLVWEPLLVRTRSTLPQFNLDRTQRRENVKNCFALKKNANLPDIVFLADDIFTTGATLAEAARVLKKAGVCYVYGLALASGMDV